MEYKNVFLDTNVLLDFLLKRKDGLVQASVILHKRNNLNLYISALSVANAYYSANIKDLSSYKEFIGIFTIVPLDNFIIDSAFLIARKDLEDAIQITTAIKNCEVFVTRDKRLYRDFKDKIPIVTPKEFLKGL